VDVSSFTAGADDRGSTGTTTGFSGGSAGALMEVVASGRAAVLETNEEDGAIGSASNTGDTIVVIVEAALGFEAPEWDVIGEIGVFTGSFIIKL